MVGRSSLPSTTSSVELCSIQVILETYKSTKGPSCFGDLFSRCVEGVIVMRQSKESRSPEVSTLRCYSHLDDHFLCEIRSFRKSLLLIRTLNTDLTFMTICMGAQPPRVWVQGWIRTTGKASLSRQRSACQSHIACPTGFCSPV